MREDRHTPVPARPAERKNEIDRPAQSRSQGRVGRVGLPVVLVPFPETFRNILVWGVGRVHEPVHHLLLFLLLGGMMGGVTIDLDDVPVLLRRLMPTVMNGISISRRRRRSSMSIAAAALPFATTIHHRHAGGSSSCSPPSLPLLDSLGLELRPHPHQQCSGPQDAPRLHQPDRIPDGEIGARRGPSLIQIEG